MNKRKILYIHHGKGIGGAPISLLNLVTKLDKSKYSVKVVCLQSGAHVQLFLNSSIETEVINAPVHFFSHTETGRKQWYFIPYYIIVFVNWIYTAFFFAPKYLKKQSFDIIHLNSHVLTSWAYAAKKLGAKIILHNREAITKGYLGIRYKILRKLIIKNCDHIINISEDNKKRLGIPDNSSVVYNFIDIPKEYRLPMAQVNQPKKILFLGGAASIKGFETVVKSLKFWDEGIVLQIAGKLEKNNFSFAPKMIYSNIKETLKKNNKKIELLKNSDKVEILGTLKNPYPFIDQCDILITPFKISHFSRPAIEAFAYGKPVIGSDLEGMDEIIDNEINGLLIKKNNPKALADAINFLCKNPEIAQDYGHNGREKAIKQFSGEANIKNIEEIYLKVLPK